MEPANRILIVRTRFEPFDEQPFVIHRLAEEWRKRGIKVDVTDTLPEPTGPDVLVFPHIDMTTIPPPYAEKLARCARVINRSVIDISKRAISKYLISYPDEYDGPVIVKTNLNFGGKPEMRIVRQRGGAGFEKMKAMWQLPWTVSGLLQAERYPIYDNPRLVPEEVWGNSRLVVEKFLPEREGDLYGLRQYIFFGESEFNTRSLSPNPRVKSVDVVQREILESTPPAVRAVRDALGFDYGKFDYVVHDGETIVFDVNRTFSYDPNRSKTGAATPLIMGLADGVYPFLGRER